MLSIHALSQIIIENCYKTLVM